MVSLLLQTGSTIIRPSTHVVTDIRIRRLHHLGLVRARVAIHGLILRWAPILEEVFADPQKSRDYLVIDQHMVWSL